MKIVVCIKQVPDSAAKVMVEGGQVTWGDAPLVMNPWDEYAVESALLQEEANGGEVTALSVGGESAKEALKTALAMGCSEAILISDPALEGADSQASPRCWPRRSRKLGGVDLAFLREAGDRWRYGRDRRSDGARSWVGRCSGLVQPVLDARPREDPGRSLNRRRSPGS